MRLKEIIKETASAGGTGAGCIATVNNPGGSPAAGQFFGGDPASSIYEPIKKHRKNRKKQLKEKKSVLGSSKPFREPGVLKATDKVEKQSILGATPKKNKTLSKKFVGCSKVPNTANPMISEMPVEQAPRAGFIPYYFGEEDADYEDFGPYMRFYVSSNAQYGGPDWQICKGRVDAGENIQQAAIRECTEECGLVPGNLKRETIKIGWQGMITGMDARYPLTIYIGEVIDPRNFVKPGFEAAKSEWLTLEEFISEGRKSQHNIVKACAAKIQ